MSKVDFELAGLRSLVRRTTKTLRNSTNLGARKAQQHACANLVGVEMTSDLETIEFYAALYFDCEDHLIHLFGVRS